MNFRILVCLVVVISVLTPGTARGQAPWPGAGTEHLPPDPTVPYLPGVLPLICPQGEPACLVALETELGGRTNALGCDHDAIFADAYLTITGALIDATGTPAFFDRRDR